MGPAQTGNPPADTGPQEPAMQQADYRVELDAFAGPLDLLLFLVRRHEIDLNDIPIAQLTDQYPKHIEHLERLDINLAGEFLVMASTLLEIKSAMLMPRDPAEGEDAEQVLDDTDPRYELVQQLLAYKQFKDAAMELADRKDHWAARFTHTPARSARPGDADEQDESAGAVEFDLEDVSIADLCQTFARILETVGRPSEHEVVLDDTPVALHAEDIIDRLQREGPMTLQAIFVGRESRAEMIGLFLATLELIRQRRLRAVQRRLGDEIKLELCPEAEPEQPPEQQDPEARWRDPETGKIDYDWPSEQARQQAERRARRRAERLAKRDFTPDDDELIDLDEDDATAEQQDEPDERDDAASQDPERPEPS
jgi:segregation and condensation protein A